MKPRTARAANAVQKRPLFPGIGRNVVMVLLGTTPTRRGKAPAIVSRGANLAHPCVTEMAELTPESPPEAPQMRRLIGEVSRDRPSVAGGHCNRDEFFPRHSFGSCTDCSPDGLPALCPDDREFRSSCAPPRSPVPFPPSTPPLPRGQLCKVWTKRLGKPHRASFFFTSLATVERGAPFFS